MHGGSGCVLTREVGWSRAAALAMLTALLFGAVDARAELQRVEAVGIYGIRDAMRSKVIPRDEAIAKARWEGVSRVARELIADAAPTESVDGISDGSPSDGLGATTSEDAADPTTTEGDAREDEVEILRSALGDDVLPYTRSYRILEDRGEVPVLFNDEPDVSVEYVVVVEVIVDVDRLTSALAGAGLISMADTAGEGEAVVVELVGLSNYAAYSAVVDALRRQFGAKRIRTLSFARDEQILAVEGPFGAETLLARLGRLEHPQLVLEPIGIDSRGGRIRLMGRWFAESDADLPPPG